VKKLIVLVALAIASQTGLAARIPQPRQPISGFARSSTTLRSIRGHGKLSIHHDHRVREGRDGPVPDLGDTIAWQAYPMGHRVHLKPVEPHAVTKPDGGDRPPDVLLPSHRDHA